MIRSEQINELTTALAKAQGKIENAIMDKENPHFKSKYASLASVRNAINGPLSDNGLSITQTTEIRETGFVLVTTLWHNCGQFLSAEYPLPLNVRPQELGSALTYARRYALSSMICNSSDEDDDANAAEASKQRMVATKPKPPAPNVIEPKVITIPTGKPPAFEAIPVPMLEDGTGSDWTKWGLAYLEALKGCEDQFQMDALLLANKEPLSTMGKDAPKVKKRLNDAMFNIYEAARVAQLRQNTPDTTEQANVDG